MGKSIAFSNALLALIFNGTAIAGLADNAAAAPLTDLWVALHSADPGPSGTQATNEATYTGYARQAISRDGEGFDVSQNVAEFVENCVFPAPTGANQTLTYFSIGTQESGAGMILYSGALNVPINTVTGVAPILDAGATEVEET